MNKIIETIQQYSSIWVAIGGFIALFAAQGIEINENILKFFSQNFVELILAALGSIAAVINFFKAQTAGRLIAEGSVGALSANTKAWSYLANPFKKLTS